MFHHVDLDTMQIETRARALRAAHTREMIRSLFARFRGVSAAQPARA